MKVYIAMPTKPGWDLERYLDIINLASTDAVGENVFHQTPEDAVAAETRAGAKRWYYEIVELEITETARLPQ